MEGADDTANQKQRMREAVDFYSQQNEPPEPDAAAIESPPENLAPGVTGAGLRYASLDHGIGFFNVDGTPYQFASPEEETQLQQAAANHMMTGEQTPGLPELDLAMLAPDGTTPDFVTPPISPNSPPTPPQNVIAPSRITPQSIIPPAPQPTNPQRAPQRTPTAPLAQNASTGTIGAMSMDNMYRRQDAREAILKSKDSVHAVTGAEVDTEEHDRSLSDILQNAKLQDTFLNKYAHSQDPDMAEEVASTIAAGDPLTPEHDKFLEKMRTGFNKRSAGIEQVQEMLTAEEVQRIARTDPRIKEVVGKVGAEKAAELLNREFGEMAMSNEREYKKMVRNLRDVHEMRTSDEAKLIEQNVRQMLSKYGISEDKYLEATLSGVTAETHENLRQEISKDYGLFKTGLDWITGYRISGWGADKLYKNFEDQTALLDECDKHLKIVGKVLRGTLTPEVRAAMQKYMEEGGSLQDHKVENNVLSVADYRKIKTEAQPADIQRRFEEFVAQENRRRGVPDLRSDATILDEVKNTFSQNEINKRNEYRSGGAIAALIGLLFGTTRNPDDIKRMLT